MKALSGPFGKSAGKDVRSAEELTLEASRARNTQEFKRAVELYRTLCDIEPREPRHAHQAAELCMRLGYHNAAMGFIRRAVELYKSTGLLGRAIAVTRLGLTIDAHDFALQEGLGDLLTIKANERWCADAQLPLSALASKDDFELLAVHPSWKPSQSYGASRA